MAIALLILAAAARALLSARVDNVEWQRFAAQYLEPLCTWCLIASATYGLALFAAGDAGLLSLALAFVLGSIALRLGSGAEASAAPADPEQAAPAAEQPAPAASTAAHEEPAPQMGLWSRR